MFPNEQCTEADPGGGPGGLGPPFENKQSQFTRIPANPFELLPVRGSNFPLYTGQIPRHPKKISRSSKESLYTPVQNSYKIVNIPPP